jgi:hypothetical protein
MLTHPAFHPHTRIINAAQNAPAMRRGEADTEAVRLLQRGLLACSASRFARSRAADGGLDGIYGGETVAAVRTFQRRAGQRGHPCDVDGIAGKQTWSALDTLAPRPLPEVSLQTSAGPVPPAESPATTAGGTLHLPSAAQMEEAYRSFCAFAGAPRPGRPCSRPATKHQCAVRMCVALAKTVDGWHLDRTRLSLVHSGSTCGDGYDHIASSATLADYIKSFWTPQVFRFTGRGGSGARQQALAAMRDTPGLVWFEDCFTRTGQTQKRGDHIDYWDGTHIMNDKLQFNEGDEASGLDPQVRNSHHWILSKTDTGLWFWPLPKSPIARAVDETATLLVPGLRWLSSF